MNKNIFKIVSIVGIAAVLVNSCGPKDNPPTVYFPDMYFPVAYDPLMKAQDPYTDHENDIPAFVKSNGATALAPVDGTVSQNKDGIVEESNAHSLTPDQYNAGYAASKAEAASPLDPKNAAKDIERGKFLFEKTCSACHGTGGDGQGPIVQSGAYSGVPNYKDRELTVASVHYVITYGRNAMGSYAGQLNKGDRWRVAMYVMNAFKGGATAPIAANSTAASASGDIKATTTAAADTNTTKK